MSDHSWSVVRLDVVPPADALEIGERLRELLLSRGVILPNDRFRHALSPSAWKPGQVTAPLYLRSSRTRAPSPAPSR